MPEATWEQVYNNEGYSQINVGTALSNSAALTDISPGGAVAGQAAVIPASYLYTGVQLRVWARGVFSTTGSVALTIGLYYGGVANTALATATFGASANASNAVWSLNADIRCDATGTAGSLRTLGVLNGFTSYGPVMLPQTSSGLGLVSVATGTAANILTVGAQWGSANAGNSIQCLEYVIEQLN